MAPLQHKQSAVSADVVSSKIKISDESDFGTGSFLTRFGRGCIPPNRPIASLIGRHPHFQIAVTLRPSRFVVAVLGHADGSRPVDGATFLLPTDVNQNIDHTLNVEFAHWHIFGASLDGIPLARQDSVQSD